MVTGTHHQHGHLGNHATVCDRFVGQKTERENVSQLVPEVGIIMGSDSDWPTMQDAATVLTELGVPFEVQVVSAHRTPDRMTEYATTARDRGIKVIIAGAGGAAHLPGMVAAWTTLPVIGVPVSITALQGVDALHSIVQMPAGVPVACVAIGNATNAGVLAARILGATNPTVAASLDTYTEAMKAKVAAKNEALQALL